MNFLDAKNVKYRRTNALDSSVAYSDVEPMSSCQIECDMDFKDILNRDINADNNKIPGLEAIWREQLNRCKSSQEVLNLKGLPSQERPDIPLTNMETYHLERLYEGLSKLNIKLDGSQSVESSQFSSDINEKDFAEMIVECIEDNEPLIADKINQTIEEVINNSQTLIINQTIEEVIANSQNYSLNQTIEDVINESQKCQNISNNTKQKRRRGEKSKKRLVYNSSDEESNESTEIEDNVCSPNVVYVDAGTQTDVKNTFDESIDSLFGFQQEMEEVVCDCDSDECCDQCCDQGSDQCECDCEKCEFEKCKRIPQLDGAFDSDDSGSNFSPDYKDDTGDSDFELSSKKTRRSPKKGGLGRKRPQSSRTNSNKRKKTTTVNRASDESENEFTNDANSYSISKSTAKRKASARRASPTISITSVDKDDDVFESSSGRRVKSSKNLSSRLWEQFKPKRDSLSLHMSFSESDGSDKEGKQSGLTFLNIKDFSYSSKKASNSKSKRNDDNRSERSLTPYLSHESDDEILPPKTKPGPKSSKANDAPKPGPKSSKTNDAPKPGPKSSKTNDAPKPGPKSSKTNDAPKPGPKSSKPGPKFTKPGPKFTKPGPKSSKTDVVPKLGPKSNKTAKPGPKSSKVAAKIGPKSSKRHESIDLEPEESDLFSYETNSRSRRSAAKDINYNDDIERTTSLYSEVKQKTQAKTIPKQRSQSNRRSAKSETESAIDSISPYIETFDTNDYSEDYGNGSELVWKSFSNTSVQIDFSYYDNSVIDTIGTEYLTELKFTPDFVIKPYLVRYEANEEYWSEVQEQVKSMDTTMKKGTRSKGALKDFYTLPHLNETKNTVKTGKTQNVKSRRNSKPKKSVSNEFARLMTDASHILDKPLGKRGVTKPIAQTKTVAKKVLPKRGSNSSKSKGSAKSSDRKSRVTRGVTSSTLFTTTSIPFFESDIRVVTQLSGAKKRSYLKSLCEQFELEAEKLPKHFVSNYLNHNISPFLFDNIYYNDYSGYLSDEDDPRTQDVLITMKDVINSVVSVSQCVNSVLNEVEHLLEPKPMLDTREEDYFEDSAEIEEQNDWDYGHYADEEQEVVGVADEDIGVVEHNYDENNGMTEETEHIEPIPEIEVNAQQIRANSPLSQLVMKTFISNDDNNSIDGADNEEVNGNHEMEAQNGSEDEMEDQNETQEVENEEQSEQNDEEISEDVNEDVSQSYDMPGQQFSPSAQSEHYSNNNSNEYMEQNEGEYQSNQFDEEADQSSNSSSNEMIETTVDEVEPQYKMQTNYGNEMYGFGVNQSQTPNINVAYHPNPLQNPIVPTLIPQNSGHYSQPTVYPTQQNWTQMSHQMPVNQMQYNLNIESQPPPQQPDAEFDVSNYSYMSYYPNNPNIPQFDGIFDDDSFHSEGNQFNMRCNSDENIEQLSQGSRSEEMSTTIPNVYVADIGKEALLGTGKSGDNETTERYGYYINGVVVKIPKSLPEVCLQQLGREVVPLERVLPNDDQYIGPEFTDDDSKAFFKTRLIGIEKFHYLQSLCNKDIRICLNRLNSNDLTFNCINFKNNSFKTVSSLLFNNYFSNNKTICFNQNESNISIDSKSNASKCDNTSAIPVPNSDLQIDEIPESPLNEISKENSDEIYSFYSDNTLSPVLSQSTLKSQKSDQSFDDISSSNDYNKQHSTPLNSKKCKTFSQTLNDTKDFDFELSFDSPKTSKLSPNLPQNSKSNANNKLKHLYRNDSLIEGPTPNNTYDFELSSASAIDSPNVGVSDSDFQYLTTMSVEVHVSTRAKLNPDPKTDAIEVIFYSICCDRPTNESKPKYITGLIAVEPELQLFECTDSFNVIETKQKRTSHSIGAHKHINVDYADDEIVLLMKFVEVVKHWDPDIIVGYKVDTNSWGYVLQRANVLNMSIMTPLSRINDDKYSRNVESSQNMKCQLCGRITLNLWSIIRKEVTLNMYNYENVHFHVLHERIPNFSFSKLTQLFSNSLNHYNRRRVIDYYLNRTIGSLRLLDKLDFIAKNSELSRLFGIQFHEVFNRGSQFRVESIMLRSTKQFDYLPISPCPRQVAAQRAPEILPLILEPESNYYCDPVVVLDFQSLYPSMMIAYNYCYSTCLGRVDQLIQENDFFDFGCVELEMNKQLLYKYRNDIHISPNGVVFLKENIRKGILPKFLSEILETRIMVKNAMKANNRKEFPNKGLHRKLDARQLGLKMISNFTYGYTSANFSGRMPCVDIADSIVAKGRETLERAINLVNNRLEWGAKVVYGDTDSMFVHFPGLSKEDAFIRGHEIADAVTAMNPKPVKLKFEKVYLPCVLETKKRYVGFSYETPEQSSPKFDAKGIETVRRDGCPAVSKILEKSLRILFQTNDLNGVKQYLMRQFQKILDGRISILNDFVFAREYRGADSYSDKSHVPSMEIAKRKLSSDPRSEPKIHERVPYVVICGPPNEPLFKLVKEPLELINNPSLRLNSQYYIERVIIPALNRVFLLMGHNVNDWFREMPKKIHYNRYQYLLGQDSKVIPRTIPQFFNTTQCVVCDANSKGKDFCDDCQRTPHESIVSVSDEIRDTQRKYNAVINVCKTCSGCVDTNIECQSIECPNLFRLQQSKLDLMNAKYLNNVLQKYF